MLVEREKVRTIKKLNLDIIVIKKVVGGEVAGELAIKKQMPKFYC